MAEGRNQVEVPVDALPENVRFAIKLRHAEAAVAAADPSAGQLTLGIDLESERAATAGTLDVGLDERAVQRRDAKATILEALVQFGNKDAGAFNFLCKAFAESYNTGHVEVPEWVRKQIPTVHWQSVQRWYAIARKDGIWRLAGNYKGGARSVIDAQPEIRMYLEALATKHQDTSAANLLKALRAHFRGKKSRDGNDFEFPTLRTLQRWRVTFEERHKVLLAIINDPDLARGKYMPALGSYSEGVERLYQVVELDSTPADVMCTDGRHTIIGAIDVYSRRVWFFVSKTSKADAICSVLRRVILTGAIPECLVKDNGQDYISKRVKQVERDLDIEPRICTPKSPWQKPHIERVFGTLARSCLIEMSPNFCGHSVADAQRLRESRYEAEQLEKALMKKNGPPVPLAVTGEELQRLLDIWADKMYFHEPHSALGKSPFEQVANYQGPPVRKLPTERLLDVLLAEAPGDSFRHVSKKGVKIDGVYFIAPEFGDPEIQGQRVHVRYDPADLGRVFVFGGPKMRFICVAENPERTGISRAAVAVAAQKIWQEKSKAFRAAYRELSKQQQTDEALAEVIRAVESDATRMAMFPPRAAEHVTDGIEAAAEALKALDGGPQPEPRTAEEARRDQAALAERLAAPEPAEGPEARYRRGFIARYKGEALADGEVAWMESYERMPGGRGLKMALEIAAEQGQF